MAGVPPKKGNAFSFTTALTSQADTKLLKANPTLAAGDVLVSKDYGAFANLATLPDAEPDAGYAIRVQLSATEMDADVVTVLFHDAAGAEIGDLGFRESELRQHCLAVRTQIICCTDFPRR